jgi:uncharacterized protein
MTTATSPVERDRIQVLDVLRGIALLGMFLVHFSDFSTGGNAADEWYRSAVYLLLEERFWATFAILFGVGFAIQLRRSDQRGDAFVARYVRRLLTLATFGFAAHAFFGFNVLLGYAAWGFALLLFRRWSVRALVIATVVCAMSQNLYAIARVAYAASARGEQAVRAEMASKVAANRAFYEANRKAQQSTSYRAVLAARLAHMRWFYAQSFSFLPVNTLTLFLLGLLGLRLGLFDEPERHRRLIASIALFGVISWAVSWWVLPQMPQRTGPTFMGGVILTSLQYGFGLLRPMWLAFAYIGIVLLLVARDRAWLGRLSAFSWTGRMALTNYMIQIAILDLTFSKYALGVQVRPLVGLVMALALFFIDAVCSRWWLARFRYGPLEWLWRSATYARWQPWRVAERQPALGEQLVATG